MNITARYLFWGVLVLAYIGVQQSVLFRLSSNVLIKINSFYHTNFSLDKKVHGSVGYDIIHYLSLTQALISLGLMEADHSSSDGADLLVSFPLYPLRLHSPITSKSHTPENNTESQMIYSNNRFKEHMARSLLNNSSAYSESLSNVSSSLTQDDLNYPPNDDVMIIQLNPDFFQISLSVFLSRSFLLNNEDITVFERVAKDFIADQIDAVNFSLNAIVNIEGVMVISQMFWEKSQELRRPTDHLAIGLDIYFQAEITVTGNITRDQLEESLQNMLNSKAGEFQIILNSALPSLSSTPESTGNSIHFLQIIWIIVTASSSFIAVTLIVIVCMRKKKNENKEHSSRNSRRDQITDKIITYSSHQPSPYPVQEQRAIEKGNDSSGGNSSSGSDYMDASYDNTFLDSLLYCPSIERSDVHKKVDFECDKSMAIDVEDEVYGDDLGTVESGQKDQAHDSHIQLSAERLSDFDSEIYQAEF